MNADPRDVRADLAGLLPAPAERDLPSDRHRLIQEFVMTQIHPDYPSAAPASRRAPRRRLILASALSAVAAATAAVALVGVDGTGTGGGTGSAADNRPPVAAERSGQQILLAAATTAGQRPATSGSYWFRRTECTGDTQEIWTTKDGRAWVRVAGSGKVRELGTFGFSLGGVDASFAQLQKLPARPAALKRWVTEAVAKTEPGSDAATRERLVLGGLLDLLAKLPVPPAVRAAAFEAVAGYSGVTNTGATEGGQGLSIRLGTEPLVRLVVDPATAQIRQTDLVVLASGARPSAMCTVTAEWTDQLPR